MTSFLLLEPMRIILVASLVFLAVRMNGNIDLQNFVAWALEHDLDFFFMSAKWKLLYHYEK